MQIDHFYHIYANGQWRQPLEEHILALNYSGLLPHIENMYVGYVGSIDNIVAAEAEVTANLSTTTVARSPVGWEQETMSHIPRLVNKNPVLYAHTKGSSHVNPFTAAWRRSMTKECIINWQRALDALNGYDTAGCHWLRAEDGKWFFGGTFWWATADYLRTLPPIGYDNRFQAEHWIGLNPNVKAFDLKPGHPGEIHNSTDWRP